MLRIFLISTLLTACNISASIEDLKNLKEESSTGPTTPTPTLILNPVIDVSMDIAHNILTENPKLTFEYDSTENTNPISQFEYSIGTATLSQDVLPWISIGTSKEFQNTLLSLNINTDYYVNIRVRDNKNNLSSVVTRSWRTVATVVANARFSFAPQWNDYVRRSATSTTCDGTEYNYYSCLHGGEKKSVSVTGENSCTGLTANDTFDAFYWECVAGSPVTFISKELNHGKGLKDLLSANDWKDIRIIVSKNSVPVFASTPTKWWTTPVLPLPDNSLGAVVDLNANTIYILSESRSTPGYRLNLNTSIIIKDGAELSTSAATLFFPYEFNTGQYRYYRNWFEGAMKGQEVFEDGRTSSFLVLNNIKAKIDISNSGGFYITMGLFRNFKNDHSNSESYYYDRSIIRDSHMMSAYFPQNPTGANNTLINNYMFSTYGIMSSNNFFINSTMLDVFYIFSAGRNTMHNVFQEQTMFMFMTNPNFTFSNYISNSFSFIASGSSSIKFTGNLVYQTSSCSITTSSGINGDCSLSAPSNATVKSSYEFMTQTVHPFIGVVSTDTKQNVINNTPVPFLMIDDFMNFDQNTRRWVNSANYYEACTTAMNCVIFDYALKSTDNLVLNKSGDLTNVNSIFPSLETDPCPAEVHGNKSITNQHTVVNTYLQHAFEIVGDEIGNDNGLCESSESCIYSPNPGAYQGHGNYRSRTCVFQNGTITNVKMYAYPNNGY